MNNDNDKDLSLFDYIQLCSFELANLEECIDHQKQFNVDQQTVNKPRNFKIGSLHIMLWNLFNLHEKLLNLLDSHMIPFHYNTGDDDCELAQLNKLQSSLVGVISYWNETAEKIKDSITMTKTADDIVCAVNKEHLCRLWQLTRLIRTMFWTLTVSVQWNERCSKKNQCQI